MSTTAKAAAILRRLAKSGKPFTADDIWRRLGKIEGRDPRCLGGVVRLARKDGVIYPTGDWRCSTRGICHGRPMRVWVGVQ